MILQNMHETHQERSQPFTDYISKNEMFNIDSQQHMTFYHTSTHIRQIRLNCFNKLLFPRDIKTLILPYTKSNDDRSCHLVSSNSYINIKKHSKSETNIDCNYFKLIAV